MIQTEETPNPDSLKFLSPKTISVVGTQEFQKRKIDEINNNFIKNLLNFKGVELVLLSEKFPCICVYNISVQKIMSGRFLIIFFWSFKKSNKKSLLLC